MRDSIRQGKLPESLSDFLVLEAQGGLRYVGCDYCGEKFSNVNVKTGLGWAETQISGMCERCFDRIFRENPHGKA